MLENCRFSGEFFTFGLWHSPCVPGSPKGETGMEMFLILAGLSLIGIAVSAVLFSSAIEQGEQRERDRIVVAPPLAAPQFFAADEALAARAMAAQQTPPGSAVHIDALLLQIARHVQLEQAAAESFLHAPTPETLHSRTESTLLN
jgi:hypothetical protein